MPAEPAPGDADIADGVQLEAMGAVIGKIVLLKENVFDLSRPDEDKWLYRLANRWHVLTRDAVIRQQLLFREGDRFSQRVLDESARLLRQNEYLYTATIEPLRYADGVVDIAVRTKDVWTLRPELSLSRSGGENKLRLGLAETNLLGMGTRLRLSYSDDVDRQSTGFLYSDNNLGDSWLALSLELASNSDGSTRALTLERPFFALDTRWSAGFELRDDTREERLYDLGREVAEYRQDASYFSAFAGWSTGLRDGWVWRWTAGAVYDDQRFSRVADPVLAPMLPEDRRLVYPFIGLEVLEDEFEITSNRDQIGRPEDFYMGRRLTARLGYADDDFGSDRDSIIYSVDASRGFGSIDSEALIVSATASGRYAGGGIANAVAGLAARYYDQISDKRLFFMTLQARLGHHLDLDNPLELGGDNGLRGYPLRYQSGDASVLFTLEERYFTDWYPFRLFRVGGAVFADIGRTWGASPAGSGSTGWLRDVGFGLRLGPTRSGGHEVIHLDIAFPLDGDPSIDNVQFLLEKKASF
ncbi:MAG TPA: hypothetical protein VFG91_08505 [Woeseiaceae bacterium]|nr:hypothetical protein [Woeseiaceae bacterium]